MASWYYVDQGNHRKGPVPAEAVREAYRRGEVGTGSLVWREGMAEWAPLGAHLEELGLDRVQPAAMPTGAGAPAGKRNTGCLIAAAIIGLVLLVILAILAAIAIPAYQDYIARSQTTAALADIRPLVVEIESFYQNAGRCPRDADELDIESNVFGVAGSSTQVTVGEDRDGHCQVEGRVVGGNRRVDGATLRLVRDEDGQWSCFSDFDKLKYLPSGCQVD